jgi:hypothetical protein
VVIQCATSPEESQQRMNQKTGQKKSEKKKKKQASNRDIGKVTTVSKPN